jgi:Swt1-like HEPN/Family of unknown function (DUF5343)
MEFLRRVKGFLDQTRWRAIIAEEVRDSYSDIFVIKSKPTKSDLNMIAGKYKSTYNMSDLSAERAARTFLALLDLADPDTLYAKSEGSDLCLRLRCLQGQKYQLSARLLPARLLDFTITFR